MGSGFRQIDHTADLAFELWAPSEEALLVTGARAVTGELTEGAPITATSERAVALDTVDPEDRLVQWLNEIIIAALVDGFVFAGAELALTPSGLTATLHGEADAAERIRQELKSATYHDLRLAHDADGIWRAQVIIDV